MLRLKIPKIFKIFRIISFKIFIASFLIGLLFLYLMGPDRKKVYVYPSPETINKAIFQDNTKRCFLYKEENVECPMNKKDISIIPVQ